MQRNSASQRTKQLRSATRPKSQHLGRAIFRVPTFGIVTRARPGRLAMQAIVYFGGYPSTWRSGPLNGSASTTLHVYETQASCPAPSCLVQESQQLQSYPSVPLVTKQLRLSTPRHASVVRYSFAHWFTKQITHFLALVAIKFTLFKCRLTFPCIFYFLASSFLLFSDPQFIIRGPYCLIPFFVLYFLNLLL